MAGSNSKKPLTLRRKHAISEAIRTDMVRLHPLGTLAMLRLSKLTDYAVVVLVRLSRGAGVQTSPGIAASTGIPEPTVAKVLKILAGSGLVASQRGAHGGYRLLRPLNSISISEVIAAMEGPIALTACVDGSVTECEQRALCPMRGRWDPVNEAIQQALSAITLADMQQASIPLVFRVPAAPQISAVTE
jgi:FeS assembly SUF system regulator